MSVPTNHACHSSVQPITWHLGAAKGIDTPLGLLKGSAIWCQDWGQPSGKPPKKWGEDVLVSGLSLDTKTPKHKNQHQSQGIPWIFGKCSRDLFRNVGLITLHTMRCSMGKSALLPQLTVTVRSSSMGILLILWLHHLWIRIHHWMFSQCPHLKTSSLLAYKIDLTK